MENKLTSSIIDAAIEVHRVLGGPGLLKSIYEDALADELELRNIPFNSFCYAYDVGIPDRSGRAAMLWIISRCFKTIEI